MAGSVNKVILVGNLGRDPEVRNTQMGSKIVNLAVATSNSWKDRTTGERQERTEWHRVVVFNERIADVAERYLRKGSTIYVEGELRTRKWTDQQGHDRYSTEIVIDRFRGELTMLGSRGGSQGGDEYNGGYDDSDEAGPRGSSASGERAGSNFGSRGHEGGGSGQARSGWDSSASAPADNMLDDEIPF